MNLNDAVIETDNWEHGAQLLARFLDQEVFFQLLTPSPKTTNGSHTFENSHEMRMQFVSLPEGSMALFYTTREDTRIKGRIAGIRLGAAINMVVENKSIDGLLLQSDRDTWLVVRKDGLRALRAD